MPTFAFDPVDHVIAPFLRYLGNCIEAWLALVHWLFGESDNLFVAGLAFFGCFWVPVFAVMVPFAVTIAMLRLAWKITVAIAMANPPTSLWRTAVQRAPTPLNKGVKSKTKAKSKVRKDPPRKGRLIEVCPPNLSAPRIWFYTDECANASGGHLRAVGLDVLTSAEAGMDGEKDDRKQLLRAQRERRILITYNKKDFRPFHGTTPHAGMLLCPQGKEFIPEIVRVCLRIARDGFESVS